MLKWRLVGWVSIVSVVAIIACRPGVVMADVVLHSPSYKFEYTDVGGGGLNLSSSPDYQSVLSTTDTAIGTSSSSSYQSEGGSQTTGDPSLSFTVDTGTSSFGTFSATSAATATSTFSVSDYTSYGYAVQIIGNPLTNEGTQITPMATDDISRPGENQFGINLVTNTSPTTFGANPNYGQFGVGSAAPNYATPNKFRYVSGETIALGPKSSGVTTYTISYIVNVSSLMPGGEYATNLALVCIATY